MAQNIAATYTVEHDISFAGKTIILDLKGRYYKKANKYIYWEEPQYLSKYPTGAITIAVDDNHLQSYRLNMDTMQMLFYCDYDSLIMRMGLFSKFQEAIMESPFEKDTSNPWTFTTQTKTIDGLKCQLAIDRDQWRVWFCADIPAKSSLLALQGLPGLVVEADNLPANEHYHLNNYDLQVKVDDNVFMPAVFKQPMVKGPLLKSPKKSPKTKAEKQQDLINQNN